MEAPRGARRNCSCQVLGFNPEHLADPQRRIDLIGNVTQLAHRRPPTGLRDPCLQFRLMIELPDHALGDLPKIDIDIGLNGDIDLGSLPIKAGKP